MANRETEPPADSFVDSQNPTAGEDATLSTAMAQPRLDQPTTLVRGACVGRYVIIDFIGRGGMGVVYEAYDPELSRRIALKLVRVADGARRGRAGSHDRILREAQALAQLSHPNVIAVYDVGSFDDAVFIAMELVEGNTLRAWRREQKPTRQEILAVFIAAGRGLAAAHAAHMIHRDFKPDNVLIGSDGRVRVVDFGLARATEMVDPSEGADTEADDPTDLGKANSTTGDDTNPITNVLLTPLTEAGRIMGTPRYMAPEQHLGLDVDQYTDQFSFSVALYEALFDQHPFPARDRANLRAQVTLGRITEPENDKVPKRLRRIVRRGLSVSPAQRYPSMADLLTDLAADPWVARRRIGLAAIVIALTGLAIFGMVRKGSHADPRCAGFASQLDGVWDEANASAIEQNFQASGRPHAAATYARVDKIFTDYAREWVALNVTSCRATQRGQQSETLLDLRSACLERLREQFAALSTVLGEEPNGALVDRAVTAALELPPVASCSDDEALTTALPLPHDPRVRASLAALRKRLNRVAALERASKLEAALAELRPLVPEARRLGHLPHLSNALYRLASLQRNSGDAAAAITTLEEVVVVAARAKNDAMVARIWLDLIGVIGLDQKRAADGLALRRAAETAVARAGDDPRITATLHGTLGSVLWSQGRYPEARAHHEQAIAIREVHRPDHPDLAISYNNYGNVLWDEGRVDEAEVYYRRALGIWEQALGSDHPEVATAVTNLGNVLSAQGKSDESEAQYQRAIRIKQATLGANHPSVATTFANIGEALKQQQRYDEALAYQERALQIWQRAYSDAHPYVAVAYNNIGSIYNERGDCVTALEHFQRALDIFVESLGPDHHYVAYALTGLGQCYTKLGKLDAAITHLERGLRLRSQQSDSPFLAESRFSLARALARREPARALELANQALTSYAAAGDGDSKAEIQSWLDLHAAGAKRGQR